MTDDLSVTQKFALAAEADAVVRLSHEGVEALRRLDGANDFHHLLLQLLAQGFERLLKLMLALGELKMSGRLPSATHLRTTHRHDIVALTDAVIDMAAQQPDYARRPATQDDLEFLRSGPQLRHMLSVLSTFGACGRYYRLEEFLDPDAVSPDDDPDRAWEAIDSEALRRHPDWVEQLGPGSGGRA